MKWTAAQALRRKRAKNVGSVRSRARGCPRAHAANSPRMNRRSQASAVAATG